jgi:hypothetical protein
LASISATLRLFEIARVLVRFNQVAGCIVKRESLDSQFHPWMTSCCAAAAVPQTKASTAIVNVACIIAPCSYHFVIAVWRAKETDLPHEAFGNHLSDLGIDVIGLDGFC